MAEHDKWGDRDRQWREDRSWNERGRDRARSQSQGRGFYGGGGDDDRFTARDAGGADRWRDRDRRHEGPAGYNAGGPTQGGWEFGDEEQGGARGQGYERYGYGREDDSRSRSQGGYYGERGRDPGVGSAYGETWGANRQYGRGGGSGPRADYAGQGGYGISAHGGDYGGYSTGQRGQTGQSRYAYGAHTPYGYRGRNEYDERGRGGEYADDGRRDEEGRSWLERAGEKVSAFFGAEGEGQHRGRGPKGYRRSDDRIREDVSDRLTDDPWLDASNIEVEVNECEVVLKGSVDSREDKRRAENLADAISGVRNVQNHLRVAGRESDYEGFGSTKMTGETGAGSTADASNRTSTTNRDQKNAGSGRLQAPDSAPGLNT